MHKLSLPCKPPNPGNLCSSLLHVLSLEILFWMQKAVLLHSLLQTCTRRYNSRRRRWNTVIKRTSMKKKGISLDADHDHIIQQGFDDRSVHRVSTDEVHTSHQVHATRNPASPPRPSLTVCFHPHRATREIAHRAEDPKGVSSH